MILVYNQIKIKPFIFLILFITFPVFLFSQQLQSVTHIEDVGSQQLSEELGLDVNNGVKFYKITYNTIGSDGSPDIASGLIVLPDNTSEDRSLVIYHHGTSPAKDMVPSSLNLDYEAYAYLGGTGYVVIAPDYLGMGDSRGFHPYVHRETQASASVDLLKAFHEWANQENISLNGNLFLTGYSQGGHASMSTHQLLEEQYQEEYPVTAAAHLSGPYSLSEVMKEIIVGEQDYPFPGFIPYTILGFQEVYGDVYDNLSDIFREIFVPHIESFYNGSFNLTQLSIIMSLLLLQEYGNSYPVNILNPSVVEDLKNNPDYRINQLLAENDTYNWVPQAPTRLFYCQADDLVPFENSLVANENFQTNGASNLQIIDVNPALAHGDCAEPAILATVEFFNGFLPTQLQIVSDISNIRLFPNPTQGIITIDGFVANNHNVRIFDLSGRLIIPEISRNTINLSQMDNGVYFIRIESEREPLTQKIIKY